MSTRSARWLGAGLALVLVAAACERRTREHHGSDQNTPAPISTSPASDSPVLAQTGLNASPGLREDPEAGARSVAQWHEHLEEEERQRRLSYDRRRLPQHREVIRSLREIRHSYAAASNEAAIRRAQQRAKANVPKLEKMFDTIDHWGVSSTLVPEYRKLVTILCEGYPDARIAALAGDAKALAALERDLTTRFDELDARLRDAAESEDE